MVPTATGADDGIMTDETTDHLTDDPAPPPGPQPPPGAKPPPTARPPLRRSAHDRKIAGVCGGLARHLDVDPIIVRVLFGVLAFFGGTTILIYGLAWLLLPEDGEEKPPGQLILDGHGDPAGLAALAVALIGFVLFFGFLVGG